MSIYDFEYLCTDDSVMVAVYDFSAGKEVFRGTLRDAESEYGEYEILSFDVDVCAVHRDINAPIIILNIETEEDD